MQMDVMLGGSSYAYMEEVAFIPTDGLPFDHLGVAAWDHPVYVMLGQIFLLIPAKDPAYVINLMSAVLATMVIWFTYRLTFSLVKDHWATSIGVAALIVSHTFWFHAVTTEVYTLHLLFMAILFEESLLWAELQNWRALYIFSMIAGLGTANHRLFPLIVLPACVFILVSSNDRRKFLKNLLGWPGLKLATLFLVGFSPWWIQFIRMARSLGPSLTWELAGTFSLIESRLSPSSWNTIAINLIAYLGWLLYQFTPIGVGLGILGLKWIYKNHSTVAGFLALTFLLNVVFSANFSVADRFNFHLPSYWIASIYISCGAKYLRSRLEISMLEPAFIMNVRAFLMGGILLLPIGLYSITPNLLSWFSITESDFGIFPIGIGVRDTARYFLNPNKRGDDSAAKFGHTTLDMLAPNALVLTPKTSEQEVYLVLRYFQRVEGMRPDVRIDMMLFTPINDMRKAVIAKIQLQAYCRPTYITSLNPSSFAIEELEKSFKIIPEANLFRVIPRNLSGRVSDCSTLDTTVKGITLQELILEHWP